MKNHSQNLFFSFFLKTLCLVFLCIGFQACSDRDKNDGRASNSSISGSAFYSTVISKDGYLYCWGSNRNPERYTSERVGNDNDWKSVASTYSYCALIKNDGSLYAIDYSDIKPDGEITLKRVAGDADWSLVTNNSNYEILAIKKDGSLYNLYPYEFSLSWFRIGTDKDWASMSSGDSHYLGIKKDGSLYAWGYNGFGQLGDGTQENRADPVRIDDNKTWIYVEAGYNNSFGISADGSLYAWGINSMGQIGDGTYMNRNAPVRIGTDTDWHRISAGHQHSLALKQDGSLYAWGKNDEGQLGTGGAFFINTPEYIMSGL